MTTDADSPILAAPGIWVRPPRQFLRPTSRRYPFDELCSRLVEALERRNFRVPPGVRVELYDYGSGDQRLRCVGLVETDEARVVLHRSQGLVEDGYFCDTAAASEIWTPRVYVHASEDRSPLAGCTYDGDDWERDRGAFFQKIVWPGEPWYEQRHRGRPGSDAVAEVCRYLRDVLLPRVESCPVPPGDCPPVVCADDDPPVVSVPEWLREVYCWASPADGVRIEVGRRDPGDVVARERYGMAQGGYCLVPLGYSDGSPLPSQARESFLWCGTRAPTLRAPRPGGPRRDERLYDLVVPGDVPGSSDCVVVAVRPRSAHEIYVADQAAWDRRRAELARAHPGRGTYTGAEIRDFFSARARTLVPAAEYRGNYESPVVLVRRELGFDEVEVFPGQDSLLEGYRW